jgi:glyoxylase-like metal-dependent hydrolase (beta-lactamase superfamily II)
MSTATSGTERVMEFQFLLGTRLIVVWNLADKAVVKLSSSDYDQTLGDVTKTLVLSDHIERAGTMLPTKIDCFVDSYVKSSFAYTQATIDGVAPFTIDDNRQAEAPKYLSLERISRRTWRYSGLYRSVLIEFPSYLVLVEAPVSGDKTKRMIQAALQLFPQKRIRYVIATHHHWDHVRGIRTAVANDATVICHHSAYSFIHELTRRRHSICRDELATDPRLAHIESVKDRYELSEASQSLQVYSVDGNQHASTLLMVFIPKEGVLIEADVYSPQTSTGEPVGPFAVNLLDNIASRRLNVSVVLPLHGQAMSFAQFKAAVSRDANVDIQC